MFDIKEWVKSQERIIVIENLAAKLSVKSNNHQTLSSISFYKQENQRWQTLAGYNEPLMSYLVLSSNGEESVNIFSSQNSDPDPDYLRGGPSHGYTPSYVNKSTQSEQ